MATIQEDLQLTSTDATELSLPIAGTGSRSYAFLIDWHIRLILALAWFFGVGYLMGLAGSQGLMDEIFEHVGTTVFYIILLPAFAIYGLYHPVLEIAMKGRTPGKRAAGIRVVTTNGEVPDVGALLIRNIFRLIDSLPMFYVLGLSVAMLSARQVRIGDMAAGTLLVYEKKLARDAFSTLSNNEAITLDFATREVAEDLLKRWKMLESDVRVRIATKLLENQGQSLPEVPRKKLDDVLKQKVDALLNADRG